MAAITTTARRIRSTTLDERLAVEGLPAELAELAETFNEMLDRLEESFQRLGRFSADIAHELRTPVNNLRGEAEVALGKPRTLEEYREHTKGINPMDRNIYRYLNFNELDSYTAAAQSAPKPNQLRILQ